MRLKYTEIAGKEIVATSQSVIHLISPDNNLAEFIDISKAIHFLIDARHVGATHILVEYDHIDLEDSNCNLDVTCYKIRPETPEEETSRLQLEEKQKEINESFHNERLYKTYLELKERFKDRF
jgi:hypothetical protein